LTISFLRVPSFGSVTNCWILFGSSVLQRLAQVLEFPRFRHCHGVCQVWIIVYVWLCLVNVPAYNILEHLTQFCVLGGFSKSKRDLPHLSWFSIVRIFNNKVDFIHHLLDKIKHEWLKAKHVNIVFSYHMWWLNPLLCL